MSHIAEIRAIDALEELVLLVKERPIGSNAGFGVCHAPSGFGKSTAAEAVQARWAEGQILIATGQEHWKGSAKGMLRGLLKACKYIAPKSWDMASLQDELIEQLKVRDAVLMIDEADKACSGKNVKLMEILRDIIDQLGRQGCIILIGEEDLPNKIEAERQRNRVTEWLALPTIDANDITKLMEKITLDIEPELLMELAKLHKYRIRNLITAVQRIEEWAAENGISKVTRDKHWDDMPKIAQPTVRTRLI